MRLIALLIFTVAGLVSPPADAQDIPSRVGRIAHIEGTAAVYYDPEEGWERAYVNSPVTSENSLWTQPGSRAEVRVSAIAVRMDDTTQLDIVRLDDNDLDAFVAQGSVAVRVRHFERGDRLVFSTPHARFRLTATGRYRIDVDTRRDETLLTVFAGMVSLRSAGGDTRVEAGRAVRIFGGPDASFVRERAQSNSFDRWALARDDRWIERNSTRYVSTYMTGYEELDAYGQWVEEPEFGAIWYPSRVGRDWVPYRDGHWENVRPWGWTWIGYEPWGYAPYHYGRWVYVRDRWGWYPGPRRVERPTWAPALVAWVGGANFNVAVGSTRTPAVGWYPLSPWDRYEPWYRAPATYLNSVNIIVRDSPRDDRRREWRERTRERGATVVRREEFGRERPVRQNVIAVSPQVLGQAQQVNPTQVLPPPQEARRRGGAEGRLGGATTIAPAPAAPAGAPQQQAGQAAAPANPMPRPNFQRREQAPAPTAATQPPPSRMGGAQQAQPVPQQPQLAPPQPGQGSRPTPIQPAPQPVPQSAPQVAPAPQPGANPLGRPSAEDPRARERAQREQQQGQERAQREQQQAQERAQREQERAQREQERAQRERGGPSPVQPAPQAAPAPQPGVNPMGRPSAVDPRAAERAQREQQQAQERAQREAQQQQQQQQQQQRQAQERAQREQQQAQERAQREAQQQQQRQSQERSQREAQQQQQQQQQQQRQAQERAQREQQQAQERAQREAQKQQQQPARPQPVQPPPAAAQPAPAPQPQAQPAAPEKGKGKGKGRDDEDEKEKEKGKGRGRDTSSGG